MISRLIPRPCGLFARRLCYPSFSSTCESPQQQAHKERLVIDALDKITEPNSNKSLNSIGTVVKVQVTKEDKVSIHLDLLVPGYPHKDTIISQCSSVISALNWPKEVSVVVQPPRSIPSESNTGMSAVQHVIAVSSCKGGVGKSTVAVNLAASLASRGLRVALLDADIYGPSLPLLMHADDATVRRSTMNEGRVLPLQRDNLKFFSFGHVNKRAGVPGAGGQGAAVMRGPIATKVINQMIHGTEWGDIDYMIVDFPPGTGDIQITLCQSLSISGAVIVTTPHILAVEDVVKGVQMFNDVRVPTMAVVENMSYFKCKHGETYYPFGRGDLSKLATIIGDANQNKMTPEAVTFPLSDQLSQADRSTPLPVVIREPLAAESQTYQRLADGVINQVFRRQLEAQLLPDISFVPSRGVVLRYFTPSQAVEYIIPHEELRVRDPNTGDLVRGEDKRKFKDITPVKFDSKGNYGVGIVWSDGHYADIFKFDVLKKIADEVARNQK